MDHKVVSVFVFDNGYADLHISNGVWELHHL